MTQNSTVMTEKWNSLYEMGRSYENEGNLAEASSCYHTASKGGSAEASFRLWNMYLTGRGVNKNIDAASVMLYRAAILGQAEAKELFREQYGTKRGMILSLALGNVLYNMLHRGCQGCLADKMQASGYNMTQMSVYVQDEGVFFTASYSNTSDTTFFLRYDQIVDEDTYGNVKANGYYYEEKEYFSSADCEEKCVVERNAVNIAVFRLGYYAARDSSIVMN